MDDKIGQQKNCTPKKLLVLSNIRNDNNELKSFTKEALNFQVAHPLSYIETLTHMLKAYLGTGLFAMGDAIKNGGIILGPISVILLGIMTTYCVHLLVNATAKMSQTIHDELELPNKQDFDIRLDFATTVEECFMHSNNKIFNKMAGGMKKLLNFTLCFTQFGFCTVYLIFVATNCKMIIDNAGYVWDVRVHLLIISVPILILCLVRSLKFLTPISGISNVCLLIVIVAVIVIMFISPFPDITERRTFSEISTYPLFFGTVLFAYEGIGCVLPLRNEMKRPEYFSSTFGVMNVGTVINTSFLAGLGFLSYWKYGDDIKGSVTLNLEEGAWYSQTIQGLVAFTIALTYPIQFYIPTVVILPKIQKWFSSANPTVVDFGFRITVFICTLILALFVPFLKYFISLVGAVGCTTICIIIPTTLQMVTAEKITRKMIITNGFVNIIAVLGIVTGTVLCVKEIIHAFETEPFILFGYRLLN